MSNNSIVQWTSFEKFCGYSPFFNETLLLKDSYPHFTDCFKEVGLKWIPCALFLLVTPFHFLLLAKRDKNPPLPLGFLAITKSICALALLALTITTLVVKGTDSDQASVIDALYVSEGLKAVCFLLTLIIMFVERKCGRKLSFVLWSFWVLLIVAAIIPFYSNIVEKKYEWDIFDFAIFYAYFAILLVMFLLSSFVEKTSDDYENQESICPEILSAIPSRLTNWWMFGLIVTGFKKSLEDNDVFDANPVDLCSTVVPKFEKKWDIIKAKVDLHNSKIVATHGRRAQISAFYDKTEKSPLLDPRNKDENGKAKSPFKIISLGSVILRTFGSAFALAMFVKTCSDLLTYVTPKITEQLLAFLTQKNTHDPDMRMWMGYLLCASFVGVQLIISLSSNQSTFLSRRLGINIRSSLISAIYKKSLTVSTLGDETSTGGIVNLMAVDIQKIEDVFMDMPILASMPFQIILAIYMLYNQLNTATFASMGVMVLIVPINACLGMAMKKFQLSIMKLKDERIKLLTEVLNGIKVLKLYAWEGLFQEKIERIRAKEVRLLARMSFTNGWVYFTFSVLPYVTKLTAFAVYIRLSDEGYLNPTVAFVSSSLFDMLNRPLLILPLLFPRLIQAYVSMNRIQGFLNKEDIDPDVVTLDPQSQNAVTVTNGTFTWDTEHILPTLRGIDLEIKPGSLVAVVGPTGSGKSSLLSSMLGEMQKLKGKVTVKTSIGYVPQEAWIQNATVRDNILFGSPYHHRKYNQVIEACALKSDLEILAGGDRTEIGEKGVNVSGGQKQRISLARAVYNNMETILLDDPLSAVDSHVGKHIFNHVISHKGMLKGKTRILVTHGIHWLPMVDEVIVINDGAISESGTYEELISRNGAFAQFLKDRIEENMQSDSENEDDHEVKMMKQKIKEKVESVSGPVNPGHRSSDSDKSRSFSGSFRQRRQSSTARKPSAIQRYLSRSLSMRSDVLDLSIRDARMSIAPVVGERLVEDEKSQSGKVKMEVFLYYLKAVGIAACWFGIFLYALNIATQIFAQIWMSKWTGDTYLANLSNAVNEEYNSRTDLYMGVYGAAGVGQGLFVLIFAMMAAFKTTGATKKLHKNMLVNVLRSAMSFFDTTPMGRIVNRFSKDVDVIDATIPFSLQQIINFFSKVVVTVVTVSYASPIFLAIMVPLTIVYILIQMSYIPTIRQLQRLDSITKSPTYVHFSETLSGTASIRSYHVQDRFIEESKKRVDKNIKFYFSSIAANAWLSFCLQMLGNLVIFSAAILAVTDDSMSTETGAMSVTSSLQMTSNLQILVLQLSIMETNTVAIERVREYTLTPREAEWIYTQHRPRPSWPEEGDVVFDHYKTRYRPGLDLVLRDIHCEIKGGEKIGIVGRTGAGKSSITVSLFRIIEAAEGRIVIDGEEISRMGLHDLRSRITILPQDPVIFSGSLRMNLDPSDEHTDSQLWEALKHSHLKAFVDSLPAGLSYDCGEGGSNMSVGQRQLLCLARTLLRKTKILILDEATAAVDFETDELIQETIHTQFKNTTILSIAHRLNTIMDYDRVMVLDKGLIKEFDAPSNLLKNPSGVFYGMAKDAGLV